MKPGLLVSVGCAAVLATGLIGAVPPAAAATDVLGGNGARGASSLPQGSCKYGNTGLNGTLTTTMTPPVVTGANRSRRASSERTWVRYRVELVDANAEHRALHYSDWSQFISLRQGVRGTWSGQTGFTQDWQGNYRLDVLIEWWGPKRRVGYRWHRLSNYGWYDQYDTGPYGPVSSCQHLQVEL